MTRKSALSVPSAAPSESVAGIHELPKSLPSTQNSTVRVKSTSLCAGHRAIALSALAALTLVAVPLGVGVLGLLYPQIFTSLLDGGFDQLSKANQQYQDGDLPQAIQMAMAIAPDSPAYADAQAAIVQWQAEWQSLQQHLARIETAETQADWETVLALAEQLPTNPFWQAQRMELMQQAKRGLDRQGRLHLQAAFDAAYAQEFGKALEQLQRISPRSAAYVLVPEKVAQYTQGRNIRAQYFLQLAFNQAQAQDFDLALGYLQQIDAAAPVYGLAQQKIVEYTEKRDLRSQYFILRAANRATLQDFAGAILLLQQVSPHSPGFAVAQTQILTYGEQLNTMPLSPQKFTPLPKVQEPQPDSSPPGETPLTTATEATPLRSSSLNPGDRLTEVSPTTWPKP